MKKTITLFKEIRNTKDGHYFNSKYWQDWKKNLPLLPLELKEIAIGMILSDACMYKVSTHALIKFEQGYKQEEFLFHLFNIFKLYCFMSEPGKRFTLNGPLQGTVKSFWFKTFTHESFTDIWDLFYEENKKTIKKGLVKNHLTPRSLAFWIMGDGSLHTDNKTMILHTQGYNETENNILSEELNEKYNFKTKVIPHKKKYFVIKCDSSDASVLSILIEPYIIPSMRYKLPIAIAVAKNKK